MARRPFQAEIIRIYEPDMARMVRALEVVRDYNPRKDEANGEISRVQGNESRVCEIPGCDADLVKNAS